MIEYYDEAKTIPTWETIDYYLYPSVDETGRFVFRNKIDRNGGVKKDNIGGYFYTDSRGNVRYKIHFLGKDYSNAAKLLWILHHKKPWPVDKNGKHLLVDHIDGDSNNNFVENIRPATVLQNTLNSKLPSNNTSGYYGVSWKKTRNKWECTCRKDNKNIFIGYFDDKNEAALAYNAKMIELFGKDNLEFLRLNEVKGEE